ncbi:MAG TPA: hypothetical protein VIK91_11400 [Nannocystis sp.]
MIEAMTALGLAQKCTQDYVGVIERADLSKIPPDAVSLRTWLTRAGAALDRESRPGAQATAS